MLSHPWFQVFNLHTLRGQLGSGEEYAATGARHAPPSPTWPRLPAPLMLGVLVACLSGCGGSDSTTAPPGPAPAPPAGALRFIDLSAGLSATCGVVAGGAAYCWGSGEEGELGDGVWDTLLGTTVVAQRSRPVAVLGAHSFASISAGWQVTCGIATSGAAYCWGLNQYGTLGDSTIPPAVTVVPTPTAVAGGFLFAELSTGYYQSCGLTRSSSAVCWGLIGNGKPEIVPALAGRHFQHMNVGGSGAYYPCFLDDRGVAFCGNVGDTLATTLAWSAISVGFRHSCALTRTGQAYCQGYNDSGQLGNDSTTSTCEASPCSNVPLAVTGGYTFLSISASHHHSCGVTTGHDVYCWGQGEIGELGDGGTVQRSVMPRKVAGGLSFASVSAGYAHTCGLTLDGFAYCWGIGGLLGNGSLSGSLVPVPVVAP